MNDPFFGLGLTLLALGIWFGGLFLKVLWDEKHPKPEPPSYVPREPVCYEELYVDRRMGADYPAKDYEDTAYLPTYMKKICL